GEAAVVDADLAGHDRFEGSQLAGGGVEEVQRHGPSLSARAAVLRRCASAAPPPARPAVPAQFPVTSSPRAPDLAYAGPMRRFFPMAAALTAVIASLLVPSFLTPAQASASHPKPQISNWTPNLTIPAGRKAKAWRSPWATTRPSTALLPSWNVTRMPSGTWLRVHVRVADGSRNSTWKKGADWRYALAGGKRRTFGTQADALAYLNTDTVRAKGGKTFDRWQIQVKVMRRTTAKKAPIVRNVAGVASAYVSKTARTSRTSMTRTIDLPVPTYSQMIHSGHFPEYGGG